MAPLLETNVRATICPKLGATDACEQAGGICRADVFFDAQVALYDLCEGPGEHVFIKMFYSTFDESACDCSAGALPVRLSAGKVYNVKMEPTS